MQKISALFVNYNSWRECCDAIRTLRTSTEAAGLDLELIVVDNASPLGSPALQEELEGLCAESGGAFIAAHRNLGYGAGMNLALRRATGDLMLVSNPDVLYPEDCLGRLVGALETHRDVGIAAPASYWDTDLTCQYPINLLPSVGEEVRLLLAHLNLRALRRYVRGRTRASIAYWLEEGDREVDMVSGCCFLMRRELAEKMGPFDESFPMYFEDADLCHRVRRAGYRLIQPAGAAVVHLFDRSARSDRGLAMERYWVSYRHYFRKHHGILAAKFTSWKQSLLESGRVWTKGFGPLDDVELEDGRPVLRPHRPGERFLVEHCPDPCFFLAAAVIGEGERWTPSNALFERYEQTVYFRIVPLEGPDDDPRVHVYRPDESDRKDAAAGP